MFKTCLAAAVILFSAISHALPLQWDAFYFQAKETNKTVTPELKNGKLQLPGGKNITSEKLKSANNFFDFDKITKNNNHAVLVTKFNSPEERKTFLGVGGHSFAIELNGTMIYDFRRRGLGNDFDPVSTDDHIIPVTFKKGENTLVIRSCRTNWLLDFCYGKTRQIKWHFTIAERNDYVPPKAELAANEILLRPTENSIVVSFITKSPVPAGIDYRISGTKKWTRQWDLAGELVLRNDKRNHIIRLEDLQPDTRYEYRLVLLEPPAGGEKRSLWAHRIHKEVFTPVRSFRTPGAKELNFFVLGDTQLSLSTNCQTVEHRETFMAKMRALPQYKKANFVCHIGDMTSYFHSIEKDLFRNFFNSFAAKNIKPWVYVRGNHEMNGIDAARWHEFFVMPDEKPYYSFKVRDTLFIVLACGDFIRKGSKFNAFIGPILDPETMVAKQRKWVEKLAKSDEFKNAKYRIVLSHIAPQLEKSQVIDEIHRIASPIMNDSIHFWIAGHSHYYWRMFKGSDTLYARQGRKRAPHYQKAKFNWITLDGPKSSNASPDFSYLAVTINDQGIRAEIVDENGKLMDSFAIDKNGNARELKRDRNIKPFKLPKK